MNDFLKKPIEPANLATVLAKWIRPGAMPLDSAWERELEDVGERSAEGLRGEEGLLYIRPAATGEDQQRQASQHNDRRDNGSRLAATRPGLLGPLAGSPALAVIRPAACCQAGVIFS
jgi:hypothetical protein